MTPTENQGAKGFYKLSWLQRIGFGSGDLAQNLIFQVICTYLLFFYTDIYGLTPSAVATMFLVGNVANVIWDPIVGALIDKSNCVCYLHFHAVALYLYQCTIRRTELITDARHQRNYRADLSTYVHGKPWWSGC